MRPIRRTQLICRWMCADSLRIYSLKGISEHAHWISRAEDLHPLGDLPRVVQRRKRILERPSHDTKGGRRLAHYLHPSP